MQLFFFNMSCSKKFCSTTPEASLPTVHRQDELALVRCLGIKKKKIGEELFECLGIEKRFGGGELCG